MDKVIENASIVKKTTIQIENYYDLVKRLFEIHVIYYSITIIIDWKETVILIGLGVFKGIVYFEVGIV